MTLEIDDRDPFDMTPRRLPGLVIAAVTVAVISVFATWPRWHPALQAPLASQAPSPVQASSSDQAASPIHAQPTVRVPSQGQAQPSVQSPSRAPASASVRAPSPPQAPPDVQAGPPVQAPPPIHDPFAARHGAAATSHPRTDDAGRKWPASAAPASARPPAPGAASRSAALPAPPAHATTANDWRRLSNAQQVALAPFVNDWNKFPETQKRKWLTIAEVYPRMSPDAQQRLHARMLRWTRMSPEERAIARENYEMSRKLPPSARQQAWHAYEALPPAQKAKLAAAAERNHQRRLVVSAPPGSSSGPPIRRPNGKSQHAASDAAPQLTVERLMPLGASDANRHQSPAASGGAGDAAARRAPPAVKRATEPPPDNVDMHP